VRLEIDDDTNTRSDARLQEVMLHVIDYSS